MAGVKCSYELVGRYRGRPVYRVFVSISGPRTLSALIALKRQLNDPNGKQGIYCIENGSRALQRLGWKQMNDGFWYQIFT